MSKSLKEWVSSDVTPVRNKSLRWLSEQFFFRDPLRPLYSDSDFFYSPADGVIIYQKVVEPDEPLVEIKGRNYCLQEAMRLPSYRKRSLVIGIFMTFYDVHVNRVPYPGVLSHTELEPIQSYNRPMLAMEERLVNDLQIDHDTADYLQENQRVLNKVDSWELGLSYYVLQIADYDVDSITPFDISANRTYSQNERFSQIRYGSQVDLIVPLPDDYSLATTQAVGVHVEAGVDTLIKLSSKK